MEIKLDIIDEPARVPDISDKGLSKRILKKLKDIVWEEAEIRKRMLNKTVRTWDNEVKFNLTWDKEADIFSVIVSTDSKIFMWVNEGTSIRHALMPKNFQPKTRPRVIGSRSRGTQKPVVVSKSIRRPGIEAREFTDEISERREHLFINKVSAMLKYEFDLYFRRKM